jgi:hypothetical protein
MVSRYLIQVMPSKLLLKLNTAAVLSDSWAG